MTDAANTAPTTLPPEEIEELKATAFSCAVLGRNSCRLTIKQLAALLAEIEAGRAGAEREFGRGVCAAVNKLTELWGQEGMDGRKLVDAIAALRQATQPADGVSRERVRLAKEAVHDACRRGDDAALDKALDEFNAAMAPAAPAQVGAIDGGEV